jgi:MerR family transcriptional regulator/heat shock protein HspR
VTKSWDTGRSVPLDAAVFTISAAAELAGMHPQTLRQYDRLGLVTPSRTGGGGRRYSSRDIGRLQQVQRLSQEEGVNLAGIKRILELETMLDRLRDEVQELTDALSRRHADVRPSYLPAVRRETLPVPPGTGEARVRAESSVSSTAIVVWQPRRKPRRGR